MSEVFPVSHEEDPNALWGELRAMLEGDVQEYADLTYEEFMDIDEGSRIGILYTLEAFGSSLTFDEIEEELYRVGILEKYL